MLLNQHNGNDPPQENDSSLREVTDENGNENDDLGSDDSEVEFINESDHDTESELEIPRNFTK